MDQPRSISYRAELFIAIVLMVMIMLVVLSIANAVAQGRGVEPRAGSGSDSPWVAHLRAADEAVAIGDLGRAVNALHQAHLGALTSRKWEGLIAVGDAALRIGDASNAGRAGRPKARQAYLAALFRARTEASLEGVLRATEAFAALGDREVVAQGLRVARALAVRASDARALARMTAIEERLGELTLTAGDLRMTE